MKFEQLMSRAEAAKWFGEVVPVMANLLLRLPSLLEAHYKDADGNGGRMGGVKTGLRILESQEAGIVFLSQVYALGFNLITKRNTCFTIYLHTPLSCYTSISICMCHPS